MRPIEVFRINKTETRKRVVLFLTMAIYAIALLIIAKLCIASSLPNGNYTVYITRTGKCYHESNCKHLAKSKMESSLSSATERHYRACSICAPPSLITEEDYVKRIALKSPIKMLVFSLGSSILFSAYLTWVASGILAVFSVCEKKTIKTLFFGIYFVTFIFLYTISMRS